jgi:hypothetical protein
VVRAELFGFIGRGLMTFGFVPREVNYYKDRKDYDQAVRAAERAGKSEW